jgi:glycosyltransferase involved in cell wall biosynthesis
MAAGLPVVSTAVGGIGGVVRHGRTGLLAPRGDAERLAAALALLRHDRVRAAQMGEAGRRLAQARYCRARMVDAYLALYREREQSTRVS